MRHRWIWYLPTNTSTRPYEWDQTYLQEWVPSQIWMSHVTRVNASRHTYEYAVSHTWMRRESHIWMCRVKHNSDSCHTYDWVMSHVWLHHVKHMNKSCHTYQWVTSQAWLRHVTHMNEPCQTYECDESHKHEWVIICEQVMSLISHIWTSHVTRMNESCDTYERVMSRIRMRQDILPICVSHVTHMNQSMNMSHYPSGWVISHTVTWRSVVFCKSFDTRTYKWPMSCHACKWVMPCVWMSHVTHVSKRVVHTNELWPPKVTVHPQTKNSCHTYNQLQRGRRRILILSRARSGGCQEKNPLHSLLPFHSFFSCAPFFVLFFLLSFFLGQGELN